MNNPDATERKIDKQGWLHTFVDDDNEIFIVDRIIEMIKYKEFLVAPSELEDLLLTHPCITEDEIKEFISKQVRVDTINTIIYDKIHAKILIMLFLIKLIS